MACVGRRLDRSDSLRVWVTRAADMERRKHPGMTEVERDELTSLRKKVRGLIRANDILPEVTTFFRAELDRRPHK
jgi:transposase-like protein